MAGSWVFFVVLLAWGADGLATQDSDVLARWKLSECHDEALKFAKKHDVPLQRCAKISKKSYDIISAYYVTFNFQPGELEIVEDDKDLSRALGEEVLRLTAALKAIGRLHVGKTRDSQKVRAIIRKAMQ